MSNFLIIGASSGIGKKLATQLAEAGHHVFATFCSKETRSETTTVEYYHLDVMQEEVTLSFLPESLDGVAYCPGNILLKPFERIKPEEYLRDLNLQTIGAIKVLQAALPALKRSQTASVVLFSTVAVQTGMPFHSMVSTSKGAVEGLTRALAAEWSPKIRVNCIAPSLTDTPLATALLNTEQKREALALRHPLKRIGTVDDIANMAEFLLTEKSGWITGQIMHVDGGMSALRIG